MEQIVEQTLTSLRLLLRKIMGLTQELPIMFKLGCDTSTFVPHIAHKVSSY